MVDVDIRKTTIYSSPDVFNDKQGNPILIKPLEPALHEQLITMYLQYEPKQSFEGLPPSSDEACIKWVQHMLTEGISLVAILLKNAVVGHAILFPMDRDGSTCEMLIVVSPVHQQCGIGSQLIHCIIQMAYELGFSTIWLTVGVTNFIAKHLYNKCGFKYLTIGDIDHVEMSLDLQQYHMTANVKVGEVMNPHVISVSRDTPCKDAIDIFLEKKIASLPVVNDKREVIGILSETDLIIQANVNRKVNDVSTWGVTTVCEECNLDKVIRLFQAKKIRCIPVLNSSKKLVGVVSRKDILAYYSKNLKKAPDPNPVDR